MEFMYRRWLPSRRQKSFFSCDLDRIVCHANGTKLRNNNDAFLLPDHRCAENFTIFNVPATAIWIMYSSIPACIIWMHCVESLERSVWCVLAVGSFESDGAGVHQDHFRLQLESTTLETETRRIESRCFPLVFEVVCLFGGDLQ